MKAIDEVKKMNLPLGEYLVCGSGILSARGIRKCEDIDLLVTPRLFEDLKKRGWEERDVTIDGRPRKQLSFGTAEAYTDLWYGLVRVDAADLIRRAEIIAGVPFQPIAELLKMKRAMHREKDRLDVALIERYLAEHGE